MVPSLALTLSQYWAFVTSWYCGFWRLNLENQHWPVFR